MKELNVVFVENCFVAGGMYMMHKFNNETDIKSNILGCYFEFDCVHNKIVCVYTNTYIVGKVIGLYYAIICSWNVCNKFEIFENSYMYFWGLDVL